MRELSTIQKREKLNHITVMDLAGPGGGCHEYMITKIKNTIDDDHENLGLIQMQKGPRDLEDSTNGLIDSDLLEIVRDRLRGFQAGPYSSRENAVILTHIEEALMWMNRRVEDRIERDVFKKYKK